MTIEDIKEKHDLYIGLLFYSAGNCKNAIRYLGEVNQKLNDLYRSGKSSGSELNDFGQRDRVFKDYIILKIAGLFDRHRDTLSLPNFALFLKREFSDGNKFRVNLGLIINRYRNIIDRVVKNRNKVVAHANNKPLVDLIHTDDLVGMPILQLIKEIENLLASVSSPVFPSGERPRHVI